MISPPVDTLGENEIAGDVLQLTAVAVASSTSLESLSRPLLDLLHRLTGLEATYLTEVRASEGKQAILVSDSRGAIALPEGLTAPWHDTLCYRAMAAGRRSTSDVERDLPGSTVAKALGLKTYVSVPVIGTNNQLMGTLCAADGRSVEVPAQVIDVMGLLARLIADQWERDRAYTAAVRRAREAEERLRERATFLAVAEHKLMSPLALVRGWCDFLADGWNEMPADVRADALTTVRDASRVAVGQVREMLLEARAEVLTNQLEPVPVAVAELLGQLARQLAKVGGSEHVIASHARDPVVVTADRTALWQVLWHLGENAIKYSPDGGHIDLNIDHIDAEVVVLGVSDEGLGVPTDIDVFAPFTRATSGQLAEINGTGLGLHIVHNLTQVMGGTVTAARQLDRGSVFRVHLPRGLEPNAPCPEHRYRSHQ